MIVGTQAEYQSDAGSTKDSPHLALMGELWGGFCDYVWENWPRYNGTALYLSDVNHGSIHALVVESAFLEQTIKDDTTLLGCHLSRMSLLSNPKHYSDGSVQDCSISSVFAMEILQYCTTLSISY